MIAWFRHLTAKFEIIIVDVQAFKLPPQFLENDLHGRENDFVVPIERSGILRAA